MGFDYKKSEREAENVPLTEESESASPTSPFPFSSSSEERYLPFYTITSRKSIFSHAFHTLLILIPAALTVLTTVTLITNTRIANEIAFDHDLVRNISVNTGVSVNTGHGPCYCGKNTAEARALGCLFDPLSMAWLPLACRDDFLTSLFQKEGPGSNGEWTYFKDFENTRTISVEEVGELANTGEEVVVSFDWHELHCFYYYWKEYRLNKFRRKLGYIMEPTSDDELHITHCLEVIKKKPSASVEILLDA